MIDGQVDRGKRRNVGQGMNERGRNDGGLKSTRNNFSPFNIRHRLASMTMNYNMT